MKQNPILLEGDSHAVLLLHGLASSPLELRHLARSLNSDGFTASVPVLDGYSFGSEPRAMEHWIDVALAEFDALAARYDRVSIVGLSIGAALTLAVARRRPQAQSVALLSLTLAYDGWAIPWYRFLLNWAYYTPLRRTYRYRESEPYGVRNEAMRARIARAMQSSEFSEVGPASISLPTLHNAARLVSRVRGEMASIKQDSLIIHAIDDETSSPRNAQFAEQHLASEFRRTIWLDDSYHMITSDNEREVVAREVSAFLRESEVRSMPHGEATPVVSKALARHRRKAAALGRSV